jgi:putative peptide zinc metalloprotease protein
MFVASVSTVIFNINPLLRFDGYYILSDLLEIPNLSQRATTQLRHLSERYLFGVKNSQTQAGTRREAGWLTFYGIASGIYRVIVFSGVLLFVADRFLIIGIVMAAVCLVSWAVVPVVRFIKYLASNPRLDRVRPRAIGVTAGVAVLLIVLLGVVPFPHSFRAPGIVIAAQRTQMANETAGEVAELLVSSGSFVNQGQPLLRLKNSELALELADTRAHLDEVNARLLQAMNKDSADIAPLTSLRDSIGDVLQKLSADSSNLTVRARHDGLWVAPGIEDYVGRWLPRGADLGLLANPASFEFAATVMEEDVNALFARKINGASVRLYGDAGEKLPVARWRVIPGGQQILPSAALGWSAGGEVPVALEENSQGNKSAEPFFEVLGELNSPAGVALLDGRSGKISFKLEPEPLLPRWTRSLWQLLQKRYQI